MKFKENMTSKDKIEALQRQILVHSMLYYYMDESVISDKRYDKLSQLLASKIRKLGSTKIKHTQYGYVFYDFDGTTGFDLIDRLKPQDKERIESVAISVLRSYKRR